MIPLILPPLTELSVLVTRPEGQTAALAARIAELGGEAIEFPTLCIEPIQVEMPAASYDLIAFLSANAVKHSAAFIRRVVEQNSATRIAAIGRATAAALSSLELTVDVLPPPGANSEALLAQLRLSLPQRVLIVCGAGGRKLLHEELRAGGAEVDTLEVYRRACAVLSAERVAALEARWREQGIGVVIATSVDSLQALTQILSDEGNRLLRTAPLLVVSERVREAAVQLGLRGECVLSRSPEEEALVGALAYWRARAR